MAQPPILIIGAGVAGLTLAQGLRLHSIAFRIFERHPRSHILQGHRFRISPDGQAALQSVLSPQLQSLFKDTAAKRHCYEPRYVDARKLAYPQGKPADAAAGAMPLDRAWVRKLLSSDIEIEYGKEFASYEILDNQVRARFADGSTVYGRSLVGADGIRSRVRKQLQPDRRLLDLERWIIWGRTPLTKLLRERLPQDLLTWCMYLDHEANVQTVVEPMVWERGEESRDKLPGFAFDDYVYWCVCASPGQFAETMPRTVEEKRRYLQRVSSTWHPDLRLLLDSAAHELSACVPIVSSKPDLEMLSSSPDSTKQTRHGHDYDYVTLVGDAAHPMSPMGGSGADTAIRGAVDLARTIATATSANSSNGDGSTASDIDLAGHRARLQDLAKEKIEHSFRGGQKFWRGKEWTEYSEVDVGQSSSC
ncbi:FAD/NAD(P)-binding domain-containing protein [Xylariaceae sp. FL0594]|nr:FAD/NAD(P)-binding domain-containing protein [Xylariaceae sp. FL0594]